MVAIYAQMCFNISGVPEKPSFLMITIQTIVLSFPVVMCPLLSFSISVSNCALTRLWRGAESTVPRMHYGEVTSIPRVQGKRPFSVGKLWDTETQMWPEIVARRQSESKQMLRDSKKRKDTEIPGGAETQT